MKSLVLTFSLFVTLVASCRSSRAADDSEAVDKLDNLHPIILGKDKLHLRGGSILATMTRQVFLQIWLLTEHHSELHHLAFLLVGL